MSSHYPAVSRRGHARCALALPRTLLLLLRSSVSTFLPSPSNFSPLDGHSRTHCGYPIPLPTLHLRHTPPSTRPTLQLSDTTPRPPSLLCTLRCCTFDSSSHSPHINGHPTHLPTLHLRSHTSLMQLQQPPFL
jgi:hypothetical protein